jgi:hypothetical protein
VYVRTRLVATIIPASSAGVAHGRASTATFPTTAAAESARAFGLHEFCIEGETEEPKAFGDMKDDEQPVKDRVKATLDKAILCLRTFKEGHVGYDYVHFFPVTFCPLPLPPYGYGDLYVPFGNYTPAVRLRPTVRFSVVAATA